MGNKLPIEIESEAQNHTELDVKIRGHELKSDEPESLGGEDKGPNPLEYMFTALASCMNVTIHQVAKEDNVEVNSLAIDVGGELDLSGFTGNGGKAGFEQINVDIEIDTPEIEEKELEIINKAEKRCPVSSNLQGDTKIDIEIS